MKFDPYSNFDLKKPVLVFGNMASASLLAYCLEQDSPFTVAGFFVDDAFRNTQEYDAKPLFSFEFLERFFSKDEVYLALPTGYQFINGLRRQKFEALNKRGYRFINYISSRASIWPNLQLGNNVIIYEHAIVQPFSIIGDNVIIRSGAHISHHCSIRSHAFIAAEVAMGGKCIIEEQAFLGVGSVVADSINVAERTFLGAGAVLVKHTQPDLVYVGNPARPMGKTALAVTGGDHV